MCGRYSVGDRPEELAEKLDAVLVQGAGMPARFNVAPSQDAPLLVATPDRRLGLARFGWTVPRRRPLLINARLEGLAANALFRAAAARHRALVPADGFYEWLADRDGKRAYFVRAAESGVLTFAALFDVGRVAGGDTADSGGGSEPADDTDAARPPRAPSFLIITRASEGPAQAVHDRMPLIVPSELRDLWLSRAPLDEALAALRDVHPLLEVREVSRRVGSPRVDEPSLRDAIGPGPVQDS